VEVGALLPSSARRDQFCDLERPCTLRVLYRKKQPDRGANKKLLSNAGVQNVHRFMFP
jgi:hypothetical protein